VKSAMRQSVSEDLTLDRLNWLIENIDEMFLDMDESPNET